MNFPAVLQSETAECGLACLTMIANAHKLPVSLSQLRQKFPQSLKGLNLKQLIDMASAIELNARPLKLNLDEVGQLQCPCIIHWDLNHFVVLKAVRGSKIYIVDPARGELSLTRDKFSEHFTGIALELTPNQQFKKQVLEPTLTFADIRPTFSGLSAALSKILVLSLFIQIIVLAMPFYTQIIIDDVMVSSDVDLLLVLAVAFALLVIFQQAFATLRGLMIIHLSTALNRQFTEKLLCHLLKLPIEFFAARHVADVVSRFQSIEQIKQMLANKVVSAVIDGLMASVTVLVIFQYQPTLALIVLASVIIYLLMRLFWYRKLKQTNEELIASVASEQAHFMESIRAIQSIKLLALENLRINGWLNRFITALNKRVSLEQMTLKFQISNALLFGIENVLVIYLGASLVLDNNISAPFTLGMLLAFIAYKNQTTASFSALVDTWLEFKMLSLHFQRISDIALTPIDEKLAVKPLSEQTIAPAINESNDVALIAAQIHFTYPQEAEPVLNNVSLQIKTGERVAIIGASGIGKSTVLKVLNGLLSPSAGQIRVFGQDIKTIEHQKMRHITATVMQDDALLTGTIADNIARFEEPIDMERVAECARLACVENDILKLPMQYQTLIGEMGSALSGGQTQRLIIARALYCKPKLLFLDEATSSLDLNTERQVNNNLSGLNISQLIIAHRSETIRSADRILMLQAKQLKEVTEKFLASNSNTQITKNNEI